MSPPSITEQKLEKQRKLRAKYLKSLEVTFSLINDESRLPEFIVRAEKIDDIFSSFENAETNLIEINCTIEDSEQHAETDSTEAERLYYAIKAHQRKIAPLPTPPSIITDAPTVHEEKARIPKIQIEPFDGTIEKFSSFKSLYDTLIHSSSLSQIEKFSYLTSLLKGKALSIIKSIEFSEHNYIRAYNKLVDEFTNQRVVATHYLNKILATKPAVSECPATLRYFLDSYCIHVDAISDLHIEDLADFIFLHLALKSIPVETRRLFEHELASSDNMPTVKDLMSFIKKRLTVLEITPSADTRKPTPTAIPRSFITTDVKLDRPSSSTKYSSCPVCKQGHLIQHCPKFAALSPDQRHQAVADAKLCFACLGPHPRSLCKSTYSCRTCHQKSHHTLLHRSNPSKPETHAASLTCHEPPTCNTVLLGTATAQVQCASGLWHRVRILIDPGSMVNFVTNSLAQTLGLPKHHSNGLVTGLGHTPVSTLQSAIMLRITPMGSEHTPLIDLNATIIPSISAEIPTKAVPAQLAQKYQNLADYSIFHKPSKVDILIGAAYLGHLLLPDKPIIQGEPNCLPTIFGNVLIGQVPQESCDSSLSMFVQSDPLSHELKRFWEIEEVQHEVAVNPDEELCEQHFQKTHQRNESGQFIVRLPFKNGTCPDLGSTRESALRQFQSLERRLDKDHSIKALYHANLQTYIDQDHLELADTESPYVLPHHAVVKQSSSHPLRIVFNASQSSTTNKTLNETMYVGPKLQKDVGDIIIQYRLQPVALCADIRQMYRCIILHPSDRQYQHIFWRFDRNQPIQEWELKRLTFGFTPASYLAQRCLHELAETKKNQFPEACKVLTECCYVDDIVCSVPTISAAKQLRQDLVTLLQSGGFDLKKFTSSSPEVLSDIPLEDREQSLVLHDSTTIKVLGLYWDPTEDTFCYTINIKSSNTATKRSVLSNVASIFDINGYLTHLVIFLKILIQKIWINKGGWDDPLPTHLLSEWDAFVQELPLLTDLRIPRYMNSSVASTHQLVGFSDASSSAMAAVVYLRILCSDGTVLTNLLRAKSKVAPLKTISIPRLELCASHLLVKLIDSLGPLTQSLQIEKITCFTDSTTVLSWLQTPPYQLKTFVANRVAAITDKTHPEQWKYVSSGQNPADLATRGMLPSQVISHYDFWFHGPEYLRQDAKCWPELPSTSVPVPVPEMKPQVSLTSHQNSSQESDMITLISQFSSLTRLKRVVAWMLRFKHNCLHKNDCQSGPLTHHETDTAMTICVRATQKFYFADVIKELTNNKQHLGHLKCLSPHLGPSDLLMVGGRLKNSPLPDASKHPILLPSKSHLAILIVDFLHQYSLHGGIRLIQNLLHRQYWIVGSRNLIKRRVFMCLKCYKSTASTRPQYMGDLPISRFEQGRCFINTALDFAGPYLLKSGPRRNSPITKAYIAVFVCMSVKAVHLELSNSLTTESCLAAIDRFIARRGKPSQIHSDQGTNFKGSAHHMREVNVFLKNVYPDLHEHVHAQGINWKFHPPGAPNFSGLAEAGVKSAKMHLSRILDGRPLYQEEFNTLLCQVEAVLNSRPLGSISSLPDDGIDYLTPGHFLVGGPLIARPDVEVFDRADNTLTRWKLLTKITQLFWKRWLTEYLHTLMQRSKWHKKAPNLKVNDVVFILSENSLPRDWPIARVTKVFPGSDNLVRVAEVQTPHGTILSRPSSKLLPLPNLE
ncbi:uncharacterized protein LOC103515252 [Diaphorina citri]|uniref:Uncharacterized protein LOC103515252 n=1 Tax=Diaphorina citri TaxID=121845 RepID=A0A1S3DBK1_DIACI|nr:uncharacterized protein LOC103515252 [Diaphorina citri]KAI5714537.1 hypothetical protein M8J77_001315 [Diaphorina citri]KAI5731049.1 hypothetical protein M8J77_003868 [Diaphorina citri]